MTDELELGQTARDELDIELGHGHFLRYFSWAPDDLPGNREAFGFPLPHVPKAGCTIVHRKPDGTECRSAVHFDIPEMAAVVKAAGLWQVESWDPLTLSPSLLCTECGDHGFIRAGRWVPA